MVKVLCLHGGDLNSNKFYDALVPLFSRLRETGIDLSLDFVQGHSQERPHRETPRHSLDEVDGIRKAHKWLAKKLAHDGPYDGVLACSGGVALASSFLLYRQWYDPELAPAFQFAVFISGSIPLKALRDLGVPVSNAAESVVAEAELQRDRGLGPSASHTADARRAVFNSDDCFGLNLNSIPLELKIRMPTVHVWGEQDPMFPTSVQLAGLCDPYIRKIHVHGGKCEVPRDGKDVVELASLLEWCIRCATWPGQKQC